MRSGLALDAWLGLFVIASGPFIGSFVSASASSWPQYGNIISRRSRCAACGHMLGLAELIPILSFIVQKGRCKACAAPIARQHVMAELASTLIAVAAVLVFSGWMIPVSALFGAVLLFIALVDYRTRLIPDGATFGLVAGGLTLAFVLHGQSGLKSALIGSVAGYGAFWLVAYLYRRLRGREGLGLGDAKLLAAGGAWLGPLALPWVVLLAASGTLVTVLLSRRGNLHRDTALPFGPALAFAIYALWLWGGWHNSQAALLWSWP